MRFITEFELQQYHLDDPWVNMGIENRKNILQSDLGDMLADSFGWQNPVNGNNCHHRLEIEAFPMNKWVEFKANLLNISDLDSIQYKKLLDLISELESYGKPAGETKQV